MQKQYTLNIKAKKGSILSLLVENQGRINYGNRLHDFKGILGPVSFENMKGYKKSLEGPWKVTGYPLEVKKSPDLWLNNIVGEASTAVGPTLYEGVLLLPQGQGTPLDTFVDPTGWGKVSIITALLYHKIK